MIQALIGPVAGLLDKFIEDKDAKNKLAHEIATMAEKQAHEVALAQTASSNLHGGHSSDGYAALPLRITSSFSRCFFSVL